MNFDLTFYVKTHTMYILSILINMSLQSIQHVKEKKFNLPIKIWLTYHVTENKYNLTIQFWLNFMLKHQKENNK